MQNLRALAGSTLIYSISSSTRHGEHSSTADSSFSSYTRFVRNHPSHGPISEHRR